MAAIKILSVDDEAPLELSMSSSLLTMAWRLSPYCITTQTLRLSSRTLICLRWTALHFWPK